MQKLTAVARPFAVAALALGGLVGCAEPTADAERTDTVATELRTMPSELVGSWHFVYDDAIRAAVEAKLEATIDDAAILDAAKREAAVEAEASSVEITAEGRFISYVGQDIVRDTSMDVRRDADGTYLLVAEDGATHELRVVEEGIVLTDPLKGELLFVRAR